MVIGDKRRHLVAVLVPSDEVLKNRSNFSGIEQNPGNTENDPEIREILAKAVNRANKELSVIEQVRRFLVTEKPITVDNEMLTPTMKNRRHKIFDHYKEQIEALY